jgi:hypothetical protein
MKLFFEHEFPKRLRYARVYMELANVSLFFSIDGVKASLYGSIGNTKMKPILLSDKDYTRYRSFSKIVEVLDRDEERVIVKTEDGYEEEWLRPKWALVGLRRVRDNNKHTRTR